MAPDLDRDCFLYPLLDIFCARNKPTIVRDMSTVDIVDDIVDSGRTAKFLLDFFHNQGSVNSVKLVTLFDKLCKRLEEFKTIKPDYCCFNVDYKFILGYGLDYDQKFREIPYIGYIDGLGE